jgi:uncharacterized membrane protein
LLGTGAGIAFPRLLAHRRVLAASRPDANENASAGRGVSGRERSLAPEYHHLFWSWLASAFRHLPLYLQFFLLMISRPAIGVWI